MDELMNADDIEAIDASDVDWKGTAENLQAELNRLQRVIREYVAKVESGERFDALVSAVPGLESDDGQYPTGEFDRLRTVEAVARGFVHAVDRGRALGVKNLGHPIIEFQQLRRVTGIGPFLGDGPAAS